MRDRGPIIVPLDGSEPAEAALPYARALATGLGAPLILLTVWEGTDSELGSDFPAAALEIEQKARAHYAEYLDRAKQQLGGGNIETRVQAGDATEQILQAANESDARALVIATHGRSGIGRWMYGSTAGHLLHASSIPILAVGPHAAKPTTAAVDLKHVMVPLDGSEMSEAALPVARDLATKLGAQVSIVRVVPWAVESYPYAVGAPYMPDIDQGIETGATKYLQRHRDALKGVQADAFVVRGGVANGLIDFVEKQSVDLVVMTTHARAGIVRAALGSVSDRMLQSAAPVLLIPPAA